MDLQLIGEPLPLEETPEEMREHFQALSQVSFQKNIELAMVNKS
jgi:hypothetical protein